MHHNDENGLFHIRRSSAEFRAAQTDWERLAWDWQSRALDAERKLAAIYQWYDRDGSVGAASEVFETNRPTFALK